MNGIKSVGVSYVGLITRHKKSEWLGMGGEQHPRKVELIQFAIATVRSLKVQN